MKILMKTTVCGPSGSCDAGKVWDCKDEKEAKALIEAGYAEEYKPKKPMPTRKEAVEEIETTENRQVEEVAVKQQNRKSAQRASGEKDSE